VRSVNDVAAIDRRPPVEQQLAATNEIARNVQAGPRPVPPKYPAILPVVSEAAANSGHKRRRCARPPPATSAVNPWRCRREVDAFLSGIRAA